MNLRPMTMDDAEKMLEWKNYPETQQFSISTIREIKLEDHLKWLENNVQYFQVMEVDVTGISESVRAGAIRVQDGEISVWVDRAFRNLGLAGQAISKVAGDGSFAKIVEGNVASMRAFIAAGFSPKEHYPEAMRSYYLFTK